LRININSITNIVSIINSSVKQTGEKPQNFSSTQQEVKQQSAQTNLNNIPTVFNKMTNSQLNKLLIELLDLPKDLKSFLSLMASGNAKSVNIQELLLNNQNININMVKQLIEENSKQLLDKLIKLTQQQGGRFNTEQFKEIIALSQSLIPASTASTQEVLKDIMLLYLPWLPLSKNKEFENRLKFFEEENKQNNNSVSAYISTVNIGIFLINIASETQMNVELLIDNILSEEKTDYTERLEDEMLKSLAKTGIKSKIEIKQKVKSEINETGEKQLHINSCESLNPLIILTLHSAVAAIFEFDDKVSLLEKRQRQIIDG
jgi:hypothetical protein